MSNDAMYVRLKPYDKKRGYLVRRYNIGGHEFLTDGESGRPIWSRVTVKAAEFLKTLRQKENDPDSKPLFDVVTPPEYAAIAQREQDLALAQLDVRSATVNVPASARVPVVDRISGAAGRAAAIPDLGAVTSVGTGVRELGSAKPPEPTTPPPTAAEVSAALDVSSDGGDVDGVGDMAAEADAPVDGAGAFRGRASRRGSEATSP